MNTHPSQEAVVEEIAKKMAKGSDGDRRIGTGTFLTPLDKRILNEALTTYAQTIRDEERERIREALNKGYEDTFHWGSGLSEPTHITEKEFGIIVNEALTNKV